MLYKLTHIFHPVYYDYGNKWKKRLNKEGHKCTILRWRREIDPFSKIKAVKKLRRKIKKLSKDYKIILLGISAGGEIALESLGEEVEKVILLTSLNENKNINTKIPIINIYSPYDLFIKMAIKFKSPFKGGIKLQGKNVKNIRLPKITHDEFCSDTKIPSGKYKNKTILEVINTFL